MVFAMMTGFFSMASSSSAQAQCDGNVYAGLTEGSCTMHFTFSNKFKANVKTITSYSFDFGDGYVLTASGVSFSAAFAATHYDPNLGFYRTHGHYDDVYHFYCHPGTSYNYIIDIDYIDLQGNAKNFYCSQTFVFEPSPGYDCSCSSSSDCDFTMSQTGCSKLEVNFDGATNADASVYNYYINGLLAYSSTTTPDWTMSLENMNLCEGGLKVTYQVLDEKNNEICNVEKELSIPEGIYIGNHDCTPKYISDLVTSGVLPPNQYSGSCPIYVVGEIIFDQDYTFNATEMYFESGAGLTVGNSVVGSNVINLTLNKESHLSSCAELWRGIRVYQGCKLTAKQCLIEDALYAIRPMKHLDWPKMMVKPEIDMNNVTLNNNYIGFFAIDGRFNLSNFIGNTFNGGPIKDNTGGLCGDLVNEIEGNDNLRIPLTDHSYAGMFVDGYPWYITDKVEGAVLDLEFIKDLPNEDRNQFNHLVTGINARSENHYIAGCNFFGIDYFDYPATTPEVGFGVNFTDALGMNFFRVDGGSFQYCRHGINGIAYGGDNSILFADNTFMLRIKDGISQNSSNYGGFALGSFTGNTINNSWPDPDNQNKVGIFIKDFYPGLTFNDISGNTINGQQNYPSEWTNGIWLLSNQQAALSGSVGKDGGNNINLSSPGEGILVENVLGVLSVNNNHVSLTSTSWGLEDKDLKAGIRTWGYNNYSEISPLFFKCNTVTDMAPSTGYSRGFAQSGRNFTTVETNTIQNTTEGFVFHAMCPYTTITQNKIGIGPADQMDVGLHYINATTNSLTEQGNRWRGNFNVWGAWREGSGLSYAVHPSDYQMPPSQKPAGWFKPLGQTTTELNCPEEGMSPGETTGFSTDDYDYMSGQWDYGQEGLDWDMRTRLLSIILDSMDLLNDPVVQNFYADPSNAEILTILDLEQSVSDVLKISDSDQAILDNYKTQIDGLLADLDGLDSLLHNNPTNAGLLNNYTALENQISMLRQLHKDFWDNMMTAKQTAATNLMAQYDAFTPTSLPAENAKTANMALLKMEGLGEDLTAGEIATLESIASTCAEHGGTVVHLASAIYSANTRIPLPIALCSEGENGKEKRIHQPVKMTNLQKIDLYPNPGLDEFTITVNADTDYTIRVRSIDGQVLLRKQSSEKQITIPTANLPEGMYIIHVLSDDGQLNNVLKWMKSNK